MFFESIVSSRNQPKVLYIKILSMLTKSICVLHPVLICSSTSGSSVAVQFVHPHVGAVHDIEAPQRRVYDEELLDCYIRDIPENKWHRSSRQGVTCLCSVPFRDEQRSEYLSVLGLTKYHHYHGYLLFRIH